ncbi:hypothetical protein [Marinilabilia sp.]|uniref:hypothetical protein n=1 Tax=Marinilabilia sp. TaxID=2021252 RepID=UPI0025B9BF57|nr:hypothetical protein [Marinilabilia sp.]
MDLSRKILDRVFPVKKIWGIHIWERDVDQYSVFVTLVENRKGVLFIRKRFTLNGFDQLPFEEINNTPVCISFDSRNILIKEFASNPDNQTPLDQLHLPNVDDFRVQLMATSKSNLALVARKKLCDEIFDRLNEKLQIFEFFLGPVSFNSCLPYVDKEGEENTYKFLNYSINVQEELIHYFARDSELSDDGNSLLIGNDYIFSEYVLPYCNALYFFINNGDANWLSKSAYQLDRYSLKYNKLYKILVPVCLGLPLLLLLVNFFFLQYYSSRQKELNSEYIHYQKTHKEFQNLRTQFEKHITLSGQELYGKYGCFSVYADRMVALLGEKVNLSSMVFHPIEEDRERSQKRVFFQEGLIEVEGTCLSTSELNVWLKELGKLAFVHSIYDHVYVYDGNIDAGRFSFRIKINQDGMESL